MRAVLRPLATLRRRRQPRPDAGNERECRYAQTRGRPRQACPHLQVDWHASAQAGAGQADPDMKIGSAVRTSGGLSHFLIARVKPWFTCRVLTCQRPFSEGASMSIAGVSFSPYSVAGNQLQNQSPQRAQSGSTASQSGAATQAATATPAAAAQSSGRTHHHHHHGASEGSSQPAATTQAAGSAGTLNTIA